MTKTSNIQGLQPGCLALISNLVFSLGYAVSTGFRSDNDEIKWNKLNFS